MAYISGFGLNVPETGNTLPVQVQFGQEAQRSEVLKALEDQYRKAGSQTLASRIAAAKAAGTFYNTAEFLKGLQDDAGLRAQGVQATLLPRINALRQAQGLPAFSGEAETPAHPFEGNPLYEALSNSPAADYGGGTVRGDLIKEYEGLYPNVMQNIAQSQGSGVVGASPEEQRLAASNLSIKAAGGSEALQNRLTALRQSNGLTPFVDPTTSGQFNQKAKNTVAGFAAPETPNEADATPKEEGADADAAADEADSATSTDAIAALRRRAQR